VGFLAGLLACVLYATTEAQGSVAPGREIGGISHMHGMRTTPAPRACIARRVALHHTGAA